MLKKGFTGLTNEALATLASETMKIVNDTGNTTSTDTSQFKMLKEFYTLVDAMQKIAYWKTFTANSRYCLKEPNSDKKHLHNP
jgi:hypothetical protein